VEPEDSISWVERVFAAAATRAFSAGVECAIEPTADRYRGLGQPAPNTVARQVKVTQVREATRADLVVREGLVILRHREVIVHAGGDEAVVRRPAALRARGVRSP